MDGPELLAGKKAKKFGDCQCVMPGRINCLHVGQDGLERLALLRRLRPAATRGFAPAGPRDSTGSDCDPPLVIRHPIHHRVTPAPEFLRGHVKTGIG